MCSLSKSGILGSSPSTWPSATVNPNSCKDLLGLYTEKVSLTMTHRNLHLSAIIIILAAFAALISAQPKQNPTAGSELVKQALEPLPLSAPFPIVPDEVSNSIERAISQLLDERAATVRSENSVRLGAKYPGYSDKTRVALLYHNDWVEYGQVLTLPESAIGLEAIRDFLDAEILWPLLQETIVTKDEATQALSSQCHAELSAQYAPPRSPRYNNTTGLKWRPDPPMLILEAATTIAGDSNHCVYGFLDLLSGNLLHCNAMATCYIKE